MSKGNTLGENIDSREKPNNKEETDFELWQSMHSNLKMPKGLFDRIPDETKETKEK